MGLNKAETFTIPTASIRMEWQMFSPLETTTAVRLVSFESSSIDFAIACNRSSPNGH
jgi:hypothetical protein